LQEGKIDSWLYCHVHGNADLNLEKIREQTDQVIKQGKLNPQVQVLSGAFNRLESQAYSHEDAFITPENKSQMWERSLRRDVGVAPTKYVDDFHGKKIVLMIDDAGQLAPGLIDKIIEYAAKNTFLRVVFALSNDDLYEKNSSDNAIDDCHLIEVPPLSENQCGEFLQSLAKKPRSQIAFNEISDDLIASVYSETQGIPGRIITESPALEDTRQTDNSLWILVASVAGLVVLALGIQWFSASKYNIKPMPKPVPEVQKPVSIESGAKNELL
jgi:DamX protein